MTAAKKTRVTIFGSGRMAAALACATAGAEVCVVTGAVEGKRARNGSKAFGGFKLPAAVKTKSTPDDAALSAPLLIAAVPSFDIPALLASVGPHLRGDQHFVHAARGLVTENGRLLRPAELIVRESCVRKIGALAGPFFAEEVVKGEPSALVAASGFAEVLDLIQRAVSGGSVRIFTSRDLPGVELGGALDPIYAIAVGLAAGLGFGAGTRAAILTRAVVEMARFGATQSARTRTFTGLSGLGDLFTLVSAESSAPYRYGRAVATGEAGAESLDRDVRIREAFQTAQAVDEHARELGLPMPILTAVAATLRAGAPTRDLAENLTGARAGRDIEAAFDPDKLGELLPARQPQGGRGKG